MEILRFLLIFLKGRRGTLFFPSWWPPLLWNMVEVMPSLRPCKWVRHSRGMQRNPLERAQAPGGFVERTVWTASLWTSPWSSNNPLPFWTSITHRLTHVLTKRTSHLTSVKTWSCPSLQESRMQAGLKRAGVFLFVLLIALAPLPLPGENAWASLRKGSERRGGGSAQWKPP